MRLTAFGIGSQKYTFPNESEVEAQDNFREIIDTGKSVIGKSGFIDQYAQGAAPSKDGSVQATFWLNGDNPSDMATKINAVGAMSDWGLRPLYRYVDGQGLQYCMARLMNAGEIYKYGDRPEARMRIPLKFDVPDPWWLKSNALGTYWGNAVWGSAAGHGWGGGDYASLAASGLVSSKTVTNNSKMTIPVRLEVETNVFQTCQFPTIQRIKNGAIVEQVQWYGSLATSARLHIDSARQRVTLKGVPRYDLLTVKTADWLTLEPGDNSFKVRFENSGDAATVKWHYQEAYR